MTESIVRGSLSQMSKDTGKSIAETFLNAAAIVLVDTSGSMAACDSLNGKSRYSVACEELARIQASQPGKVAVISFSDEVMFCPSGVPWDYGGGTHMDKALDFSRVADVPGMKFILISDGCPDDEEKTLRAAKKYKNSISTIYVGPERDGGGMEFLAKLAAATGGQAVTDFQVQALEANVRKLLA